MFKMAGMLFLKFRNRQFQVIIRIVDGREIADVRQNLDAEAKDKESKDEAQADLAAWNLLDPLVTELIASDPDHEDRDHAIQDGVAKASVASSASRKTRSYVELVITFDF